ncbi:tRNA-dihydrouridine synthase 2 [Giardia muris]|uniref:tRNA-dihydrouridine synthase 2 n=1 Tax=Giardia muris TaxID=5742 RepID=A0A4Z1T3R5_GIAMU|nr:tRNA-dihydrouridine synthase 2 [Giardia muris]|eukprot:TNJ28623.1 tRNA-dihydrouridine synthase 2 [Giardia muris]
MFRQRLVCQSTSPGVLYEGPLLAPMVRASNEALRLLSLRAGATAVYSEAIVCSAIVGGRVETEEETGRIRVITPDRGEHSPERILLTIRPEERKRTIIQLVASTESEGLEEVIRLLEPYCGGIDLNLGCPARFATQNNMGSKQLKNSLPLVRRVKANLVTLPLSVKIRLLTSTDQTIGLLVDLFHAGVTCVAIHMRLQGQARTESAAWSAFFSILESFYSSLYSTLETEEFKEACARFWIVANGDLYSRDQIDSFFTLSATAFTQLPIELQPFLKDRYGTRTPVMLARGAICDATLFTYVRELQAGSVPTVIDRNYFHQVQDLLEAARHGGARFTAWKYTVVLGITLVRQLHLYRTQNEERLYKECTPLLSAGQEYDYYDGLLSDLSAKVS